MTCLGVLDRGERGDDNETGLKEGGVIKIETTVLLSRAAPLLEYLPACLCNYQAIGKSRKIHWSSPQFR